MEIASRDTDRVVVLSILAEFADIPDSEKLEILVKLMYCAAYEETKKKQFQKLLSSLPVESVKGSFVVVKISTQNSGEHQCCVSLWDFAAICRV